ncbi:hypothetical protein DFH07DRAFT_770998 [Mycena maculata]|uniref:Uncharacterized protein n=1 Tax=Mycena maculata TaxID=230809 RepID=A0AAD7JHP4_9AGAR|nr:hypothetical protein DFH07DRAFT_770998 [Mycena maculata]
MARHLLIRRLDLQRQFKDALDAVTKIQREIREKRAWLEIVDGWISCPPPPSPFPRSAVIIPADDSRLGVWINSTTEKDTYWFLTQAAVPCFMIQELGVDQKPANVCHSFVERTEVEGLLDPTKNPEDAIVHGDRLRDAVWSGEQPDRLGDASKVPESGELVMMHDEHVPWLCPPLVAGPNPKENQRAFTTFCEDVQQESEEPGKEKYAKRAPSCWMYKTGKPVPLFKGREARPPAVEQLPRKDNGAHEASDSSWAWTTGKANEEKDVLMGVNVTPLLEVDEDTVSLGELDESEAPTTVLRTLLGVMQENGPEQLRLWSTWPQPRKSTLPSPAGPEEPRFRLRALTAGNDIGLEPPPDRIGEHNTNAPPPLLVTFTVRTTTTGEADRGQDLLREIVLNPGPSRLLVEVLTRVREPPSTDLATERASSVELAAARILEVAVTASEESAMEVDGTEAPSLLGRLGDAVTCPSPLPDLLRWIADPEGEESAGFFERFGVGLEDRVGDPGKPRRRWKHRRAEKRLAKMEVMQAGLLEDTHSQSLLARLDPAPAHPTAGPAEPTDGEDLEYIRSCNKGPVKGYLAPKRQVTDSSSVLWTRGMRWLEPSPPSLQLARSPYSRPEAGALHKNIEKNNGSWEKLWRFLQK